MKNYSAENLSKTSAKIGELIKLINEVAGQINLLTLNATIEAAHAGEAGKELKSIANRKITPYIIYIK
jgi:methyl-accepting chemotaxis protein